MLCTNIESLCDGLLLKHIPSPPACACPPPPPDVKLFEDQGNSDAILDDLACMLGCTRSSLHGGL